MPIHPRARALRRAVLVAVSVLVALAAPARAVTLPPGFETEVLGEGMGASLSVEFAPDGRMFVATSSGGYVHIFNPGSSKAVTKLDLLGAIYGIALDTDFARNGYLYAVRTQNGHNSQRLVRMQIGPDNKLIGGEKVLVGAGISCKNPPVEEDCMSALGAHDTGTVRSDPRDGTIWFGNGDNQDPGYRQETFGAQADTTLTGKILHVDREGRGLPNHPFCPGVTDLDRPCTKVWAKGFRNPYRFSFRPNGDLLVADVGWASREEVSLVRTGSGGGGRNYGWPCYEGTLRTPSFRDDNKCLELYAKEGTAAAAVAPGFEYAHIGHDFAVLAGPTYRGGTYPADFVGDAFIGDFGQGWIKRIRFDEAGNVVSIKDFASDIPDLTDMALAPNGDLVYTELRGRVLAIRSTSTNRVPIARASATPTSGKPPLSVRFSSAGSSDPDGDPLTYDWDFGDGTAHATTANPTHSYTRAGTFAARLTVHDRNQASASAEVVVNVGNAPPTITLTAPARYRDGQTLKLSATATDAEDGALPASAFHWETFLVHDTHTHLGDVFDGVRAIEFLAPDDHDADSFHRVTLTVTDTGGASTARTVDIKPETVPLSLTSEPPGAPLVYHGVDLVAPASRQAAIGLRTTVSAAQRFTRGGTTYEFRSWSDGGARLHDITIPATALALKATYAPVDGGGGTEIALEAEAMTGVSTSGAIRAVSDAAASGGRIAFMSKPAALSQTVDLPATGRLTVFARGQLCGGAPILVAQVDGREVLRARVSATAVAAYAVPLLVPAGPHTLRILYQGDVKTGACDRNLFVDRVVVSPDEAAPPPTGDRLDVFEAEAMTGVSATGAAQAFSTPSASGGTAVRFVRNGRITIKRRVAPVLYLVARAMGEPCDGDPVLVLRRNGAEVFRAPVPDRALRDFTTAVQLPAGDFTFEAAFVNDRRTTTCDRNLVLDALSLYAADDPAGLRALRPAAWARWTSGVRR
jgi:glucose/arabinose dehydrogenase